MKKFFLIFLFLLVVAGVAIGVFAYKNLRGVGPVATRAPENIADILENKGQNITDFPLHVANGFAISLFARDLAGARDILVDGKGNMWVSRPKAGVVTFLDVEGGKVVAQEDVLKGLDYPHGLAISPKDPNTLYIANETSIVSVEIYRDAEGFKNQKDIDVVKGVLLTSDRGRQVVAELPKGGRHRTRSLEFDDKGNLFVSIGSTCDVCKEKDSRVATVMRVNMETKKVEPYVTGLRNAVFLAKNPSSGKIWVTEMGRDGLGDDTPPDEINILEEGKNYGWPYVYGNNILDEKFSKQNPLKDSTPSHIDLPAHSAPLGLSFIPQEGWSSEYQDDLFVGMHGSWNRSTPIGYKIVRVQLDKNGNYLGTEDFVSGWLEGNRSYGRPVDILAVPGGIAYASDDKAGVIYKIELQKNTQEISRAQDGCKISGCSAQICSEEETASDCMYREEYTCYQKAICKKQQNGKCGWTETPEITACIKQFTE